MKLFFRFSLLFFVLSVFLTCVSCSRPNYSQRRLEQIQNHVEQNMNLLTEPEEQPASAETGEQTGGDENSEAGTGISPYLDAIQNDLKKERPDSSVKEETSPEATSEPMTEGVPDLGLLKRMPGNKEYETGLKCAAGFECEKNDEEAVEHFHNAAEQGNIQAAFAYGACLYQGLGVKQNYPEALKWLTKAAEQNLPEAVLLLAHAAINGNGMEQNPQKAAELYEIAAQKGLPKAQFALGLLYLQGLGVKKNDVKAVKWFTLAANADEVGAQYFLGMAYLEGCGVSKDEQLARSWLHKAHKNGWNEGLAMDDFPQTE